MPEISITESQKKRFDALRAELAAGHAGPYASVRSEDIVEYLLDLAEEADGVAAPGAAAETDGDDGPTASGTPSPGSEETVEESMSATPDPSGGLDGMLNLLERHDDKWQEASGDERYEVELEDGSVETARTKDDVKAILFEHY